jgi:DNA invertase Pin-like site-specific DNA recombinase
MAIPLIYARVSTVDKQDYNRQINDLKQVTTAHGYEESTVVVFAESISGFKKKDKRPKLNEMLNIVKSSPNDYVIYTTEISRIGRDPSETRRIIDELTDLGVPIYIHSLSQYTIDKDGKRNMIMNIILQVLMEYANFEAENFKVRSKSGLLNAAKKGKAGGAASIAYGYKTTGKKGYLVVNKKESETVKLIFQLYSEGNGIKVISNILNEREIPTKLATTHKDKFIKFPTGEKEGSKIKWTDVQVHSIIQNPLYKGQRRFKDELIPAPAIITPELFDNCTEIRLSKTHRNYLTTYTYLLKDMCTCGKCGRNYFAKFKPTQRGDKVYICSSRLIKGGSCNSAGVNISLIESAIYNEMIESDLVLKYISNANGMKDQLYKDIKRLEQQLKLDERELASKVKEKERLLDVYLSGDIIKTVFTSKQAKLESEIDGICNRVDLASIELEGKKGSLKGLSSNKTSKVMLRQAWRKRSDLKTIFGQVIHKCVINHLDQSNVLVTVYLCLNGVVIPNTLKLVLDKSGLQARPQIIRYKSLGLMNNEPLFKNGKLITDVTDILDEFNEPMLEWLQVEKVLTVL